MLDNGAPYCPLQGAEIPKLLLLGYTPCHQELVKKLNQVYWFLPHPRLPLYQWQFQDRPYPMILWGGDQAADQIFAFQLLTQLLPQAGFRAAGLLTSLSSEQLFLTLFSARQLKLPAYILLDQELKQCSDTSSNTQDEELIWALNSQSAQAPIHLISRYASVPKFSQEAYLPPPLSGPEKGEQEASGTHLWQNFFTQLAKK